MISHDSDAPQATPSPEAPALDPRAPIEVASGGTGPINDPGANDTKPPGYGDHLEHFI